LFPATTWVRARTTGATAAAAGTSRSIASASSGVNVGELPPPKLTPPLAACPGMTKRLFAPRLWILSATARFDPWPISTIAITAATPITIPSVVRADRKTFRRKARKASDTEPGRNLMARPPRVRRTGGPR
jgi:hypothetical protein